MNFATNSHFETPERIRKNYAHFNLETGKFSGKPSFDGQYGGVPLMFDAERSQLILDGSDNHTLVFGSSGSKKSRSVVLPTIHMLCNAGESMIIHDAKGELYKRTAAALEKNGYQVIAVNLRMPEIGHAWNPLTIPYRYYKSGDMDKAAEFANDVASTITLGDLAASNDPFWERSAHDCTFGLILMLFRYCKETGAPDSAVNMANLAALRRALFERGIMSKNSWLWRWGSQDEFIAASLSGTVLTASETMQGILSVLDQKLRTFTINGSLMDMLSNSTFEIDSVGHQKTAVFLITPDEKTSYHPLVAIFVSQSYQHLIYAAEKSGGRVNRRINYILDEFSSLPAIGSDFPSMITAARSRNIRFLIVVQSKGQLVRRYEKEAATIMANCTNWIIMFTRELDLLNEVSELCGKKSNGMPNISVYDLQHLSKEKDQVLLLAGRLRPAVVNLMDIRRLDRDKYKILEFVTPERTERYKIDFSTVPNAVRQLHPDLFPNLPAIEETNRNPFSPFSGEKPEEPETSRSPFEGMPSPFRSHFLSDKDDEDGDKASGSDSSFNVDDLIAKLDAKIAELEAEEARENLEKSDLNEILDLIEKRRDGLICEEAETENEEPQSNE